MHERAEQFLEPRRPLVAFAGRMNDEVVADTGDFVFAAELAEQLSADFSLRIAPKAAGNLRIIGRSRRRKFHQLTIAGQEKRLVAATESGVPSTVRPDKSKRMSGSTALANAARQPKMVSDKPLTTSRRTAESPDE